MQQQSQVTSLNRRSTASRLASACPLGEQARRRAECRRELSVAALRGRRDDERGLTTLEWLLIVAAVAGIAALAVVLVQNVVSDVSEQIAGSNARVVAAKLAGEQIERDAKRPKDDQPATIEDFGDWQRYYEGRCERLEITYGDAGVSIAPNFNLATDVAVTKKLTGSDSILTSADSGTADAGPSSATPSSGKVNASCLVS